MVHHFIQFLKIHTAHHEFRTQHSGIVERYSLLLSHSTIVLEYLHEKKTKQIFVLNTLELKELKNES